MTSVPQRIGNYQLERQIGKGGMSEVWLGRHRSLENRLIAVKCQLSKGVFSSERAFEVKLANGELYSGPTPRHYCWNADGQLIGEKEAITSEIVKRAEILRISMVVSRFDTL